MSSFEVRALTATSCLDCAATSFMACGSYHDIRINAGMSIIIDVSIMELMQLIAVLNLDLFSQQLWTNS
jgi:hypothetical protein